MLAIVSLLLIICGCGCGCGCVGVGGCGWLCARVCGLVTSDTWQGEHERSFGVQILCIHVEPAVRCYILVCDPEMVCCNIQAEYIMYVSPTLIDM